MCFTLNSPRVNEVYSKLEDVRKRQHLIAQDIALYMNPYEVCSYTNISQKSHSDRRGIEWRRGRNSFTRSEPRLAHRRVV
jgi:hypothetical protein